MSKLDLVRVRKDLAIALTGEMLIRHYCPGVDIESCRHGSEYKIKCCLPGHDDDTPSLFISADKFVYHCKGKCNSSASKGDFINFIQVMDNCAFIEAIKKACDICGLPISVYEEEKTKQRRKDKRPPIEQSTVDELHNRLIENKQAIEAFSKRRNLTLDDIKEYKIGIDKFGNYTLPIYDEHGKILSIKYRHKDESPPGRIPKYWSHKIPAVDNPDKNKEADWYKYGDTKLFGVEKLVVSSKPSTVIIAAGEYDAIQINRLKIDKFVAISSTSGEGTWDKSWTSLLEGHDVYVCFDNDATGRVKSKQIADLLKCKEINIEKFVGEKGDITDFFCNGHTIEEFSELIDSKKNANIESDEFFNEEERSNILRTLKPTEVKSVNPAFFIDESDGGTVYITSMFEREKETELKSGEVVTFKTNEPMIISSKRGVYEIPRVDKEIAKQDPFAVATFRGWTVKQEPNTAQIKWCGNDVITYLNGREPYSDVRSVFMDIYNSVKRYSKMSRKTYRGLVALYIMGSYFYEGFQSYPYLHLNGEKGSGKTTLGKVIAALSFNGEFVIAPTLAAVARSIQEQKGLCVFDEVEQQSQRSQGRSELGQIFNAGYQRGAKRMICDASDSKKIVRAEFDLYCPKVICNIFGLNDTTKNRCISIIMKKINIESNKQQRDAFTDPVLREISKHMYEIMMCKTPAVLKAYQEVCSMDSFELIGASGKSLKVGGRERELYSPIFAMAKFICNETGYAEPWNRLVQEFDLISNEKMLDEQDEPEEKLRMALRDEMIDKKVNELDLSMYDLIVLYKGQYVESPGNQVEHWMAKTLRKLNLCEQEDKPRRKLVTITSTTPDGRRVTEKKKLMVFKVTRELLGMPAAEIDEKEIPF